MPASFYPKDVNDIIVKEWLNGATTEQLMKKYGYKTRRSITDKLKQKGITTEQLRSKNSERSYYHLDLSKIDDMFKAYFLCLMATDGYICDNGTACGIDLTDEDCIQSISLYTGKPYQSYDKTKYAVTYHNEDFDIHGNKKVFRIRFDGKSLVDQFVERGIIPHKSKTIKSIILYQNERKFYPYVIRGIIDGDGNIFHR